MQCNYNLKTKTCKNVLTYVNASDNLYLSNKTGGGEDELDCT